MEKNIEIKDIDWKEEYIKMAERCKMLEEELNQEQEKNRKCSDEYNEILKRLDIIGDMVGWYIKDQRKDQCKEKLERAKQEYEAMQYEYSSRDLHYSNQYRDDLRSCCQCEEG